MGYIRYRKRRMAYTSVVLGDGRVESITINLNSVCAFYKAENDDYTMVILSGGTICLDCKVEEFEEVYNEYLNNL